jgi:double-strand break repair protein MRE11
MRIVVCSDVHLGFEEKDPIRKEDSYAAFEEVLQRARGLEADLVLVGGDLFHEQCPSTECFNRTIQLLSRHVLGTRSQLEVLGESSVNWLSPEISVSLPVLSIHGNHDEPIIDSGVSALHLLHSTNLITYLRNESASGELHVRPTVLRKPGGSTLAVYGLGFVKDQVLHQMFRDHKVTFHRALADMHILLLHQNRYKGQGTPHESCLPEHWVPDFIDLVVWGNEHESLPESNAIPTMKCRVVQPGSTVATSLIAAEARPKHAVLIDIGPSVCDVSAVPLTSPRQFFFTQVDLSEHCRDSEEAEIFLRQLIQDCLQQAHALPLVRIKAEVTGFDHVRVSQINSEYADRIANKRILTTWKRRVNSEQLQELHCERTEVLDMIQDHLNAANFQVFSSEMFKETLQAAVEHGSAKDFCQLWDSRVSEMTQGCSQVELGALDIAEVLSRLNFTQKKPHLKRGLVPSQQECSKRLKFT